jgi:lysophospholipase L1-like esterase
MAKMLNAGASPEAPSPGGGPRPENGLFWVVEEGLNGRTTCLEDPIEGDKNGLRQLIPILRSHRPLDLVIVMLGSNDLKRRFNPTPYDISHGAQLVAKAILASETGPQDGKPTVLMVCPPPLIESPAFRQILDPGAVELSHKLSPCYAACARECGAAFFDAGSVVTSSPADGLHWEAEGHLAFAQAMAGQVRKLLG